VCISERDVLLPNIYPHNAVPTLNRSILHDPAQYPDPQAFKPERFIAADGQVINDPMLRCAYGYGGR